MTTPTNQDGERRRGRRPGGTDTRAALLTAAREVFSEQGYDNATVRAIARRAEVDPAMVNHWFGGKESLFTEAVLELPFNPQERIAELAKGDLDTLGERVVRTFLTSWDVQDGGIFAALIRSVASRERVASALKEFFQRSVFGQLTEVADDSAELRANLLATQMIGLGVVRYVARFEPVASAGVEVLVKAVGPTVQRYLTGSID
ncbi:TetR family transcriptional regulator [Actinokineospora sp. NBRC 105648]|uniref:TetR/AcrR family transcriptional regulator n=1 Tax=Actinokineospora sp. NBRC 105648 TaxID=3032206 RepID=UPI0024A18342|nr:TetR family transcriptional regulator [Actinokineospora sp. NBRC 105648]GLZ39426.1 TetR family transcriptional regulator [Actinokineospora sp. NBRC 105648]